MLWRKHLRLLWQFFKFEDMIFLTAIRSQRRRFAVLSSLHFTVSPESNPCNASRNRK